MADKSISELTAATQVGSTDLFVLEQSGVAKKLTGQILENWLVALADGHGGIQDIEKTSTSGLIDTYTITLADETVETFTVTNGKAISSVVKTGAVPPSLTDSYRINYNDGTHYDFTVTNGKGVTSIEKTSTSGLVDTYTITYNDSTTGTITVTNGKAITSITDKWAVSSSNTQTPSTWYNAAPEMTPTNRYLWHYQVIAYNDNTSVDTTKAVVGVYGDTGDAWYMWIKYAANEPTRDSDMVTIPNKWIGIYSGTSSTAPVHYTSYDWYEYKGEKGDTGDAAEVTSTAIVYQASESGTNVPTGTWVDTVPTVVQGQFLWTRVTVNWNDGTSAVWYSVSYVAIDGEGSPGSQTPLVDSGSGVVGTATAYSRQDHQHPLNVPSSGEPAMDGTASRGNADTYSRSDHVHPTDTSRARVADMAAAYSQRTYAKGELCIYENVLYRCKDGIPTAEAWNSSHWETTNIGVELGDLNGALTSLENSKAVRYDAAQSLTAAQKIQVFSNIFGANNNAGFHNSFFRGKSLGTSFTTAQHNAISAGTFDDMFIGDYWTIGGIDYVICHFDYYYRCSDSDINYHHIVVMPRGVMTGLSVTKTSAETSDGYYQWNETNTTSGGYIASRMRTVIMPACDTKVKAAFGSSYVKTISELYPNGHDASTGRATGWAWTSTDLACDLCNETMVYGAQVWSISNDGRPGYEVGIDKWQLAIFRLYPAFANIRAYWWLRSVSSAAYAARVDTAGYATIASASTAYGVRPRFLVS